MSPSAAGAAPVPLLLRGVDRAAFAVSFAMRLRARGIAVGFTAIDDFSRALEAAMPASLSQLYWTSRITLVAQQSDLAVFDAVFSAVFDGIGLAMDPHARRTPTAPPKADDSLVRVSSPDAQEESGGGLPWATLPNAVGAADDSDALVAIPELQPSRLEGLADTPFEQLSAADMDVLGTWLQSALHTWPTRRSRRFATDPTGHRIAVRATIARSRRTGWEPIDLVRVRPVSKPRKVVMLCDVSQSMQAQATAYFHLMRALALTTHAEVFAFATTLTRLTPVMAHKSTAYAIERATTEVTDRFGGTRIAANIQALLSSHHGSCVRGAIVIIGSDGWDSEPPEKLAAAMARLRRRAHRVVWMNPRAAAPGFQPIVSTMAAALPFCDELLPADDFRSLAAVVAEIGSRR